MYFYIYVYTNTLRDRADSLIFISRNVYTLLVSLKWAHLFSKTDKRLFFLSPATLSRHINQCRAPAICTRKLVRIRREQPKEEGLFLCERTHGTR